MELNFELHPAQMEIFQDPARFKVVAAGRRFGKSFLAAIMLLIEGMKDVNEQGYKLLDKRVFYVAPTFDQGKRILWNLIKELGKDVIDSTYENQAIIKLVNGRQIEIKGSDRPDTLRGVGLSFVVLDEYAFMRPDVWEQILQPTLADVEGGALFIGTPAGKNHFYELAMAAERDNAGEWTYFHYNSVDNPTINPKEIERARRTLSSHNFKQEHEASFQTAGGGLLKEEYIQFMEEEPTDGYWYVTVDPAGYQDVAQANNSKLKRLDETAICVAKCGPFGWYIAEIDHGRWGIKETAQRILQKHIDYQSLGVGIEQGALKNAIMPYLIDEANRTGRHPHIVPLTHGGKKKEDRIIWSLQGRFEHGRIFFKPGAWNKDLVDQMLDFPNPTAHDDLLDALSYMDQMSTTVYADEVVIDDWEPLDDVTGF